MWREKCELEWIVEKNFEQKIIVFGHLFYQILLLSMSWNTFWVVLVVDELLIFVDDESVLVSLRSIE